MKYYKFENNDINDTAIGKLVCLARTYKKHAKEMQSQLSKNPILFLKPATSVIFDNDSIIKPPMTNCLHHEIELGVVIGKKARNVSIEKALNYVLGYCVCLDITARDIQAEAKEKGWPWDIAKGFDTFAPISDVVLKNNINPNDLDLILKVNGQIHQNSNTKNMIYSVEQIIGYISNIMTLDLGDLIMTGTPEGVGEIKKGDVLEAELGDICKLKVDVR